MRSLMSRKGNGATSVAASLQQELYATTHTQRSPPYQSLFGFSHNPYVPNSIPVAWTVREGRSPFWVPDSDWITDPVTGALLRRIDEPETAPKPIERQQTPEPLYRRFLHGVKDAAISPFSYVKEHGWGTVPGAVVSAGKAIGQTASNTFAYAKEHPWQVAGAVTLPLLLVPALAACSSPEPTPSPTPPELAFTPAPTTVPDMALPAPINVEIVTVQLKDIETVREEFRKDGQIEQSRFLSYVTGPSTSDGPAFHSAISFDFLGNDGLRDVMVLFINHYKEGPGGWTGFNVYENTGISFKRGNGLGDGIQRRSPALEDFNVTVYKIDKRLFFLVAALKGEGYFWVFDAQKDRTLWPGHDNNAKKLMIGNFDDDPQPELAALDYSTPVRIYEFDGRDDDRLIERHETNKEISQAIKDFARAYQKGDKEDLRLLWQEHGPAASLTALALLEGSDPETYRSALQERLAEENKLQQGKKLQQIIWERQQLSRAERTLLDAMQSGNKDGVRATVEDMRTNNPAPALAAMFRIGGDDFQRYVSERVAGLDVAYLASDLVRGRFDSAFANAAIGNYGGALFDVVIAYGIERGAASAVRYIGEHENLSPLRERNDNTTYALGGVQIDRDLLTPDEQHIFESGGVISVNRMDKIKAEQKARNEKESMWSFLFGN